MIGFLIGAAGGALCALMVGWFLDTYFPFESDLPDDDQPLE